MDVDYCFVCRYHVIDVTFRDVSGYYAMGEILAGAPLTALPPCQMTPSRLAHNKLHIKLDWQQAAVIPQSTDNYVS